jgi:hypothetical protein
MPLLKTSLISKITLFLVASMLSMSAIAVSESQCRDFKKVAEMVMDSRQADIDILDLVDAIDGIKETKEGTHYLIMSMIESAYLKPVYNTPKLKERAVKDFGLIYYLSCSSID